MPDPATAYIDPFFDETTLVMTCDVVEPSDGKGYDRDPRSIAKRAEAYLKSTGIGDTAYFGPEPEFFIFDSVEWNVDMSGCLRARSISEEAAWTSGEKFEGGNIGHRPDRQGRLLPGSAGRQPARHPFRHVSGAGSNGRAGRSASPRSRHRRPVRNRHQVQHPGAARRLDPDPEVRGAQRRPPATARPPPSCRSRSSATTVPACTCTSRSGKTARTCSPATATPACPRLALYYIGGIIKHAKALNAITNPGTNSYKRLVPRLRSAGQAGLLGQEPFRFDPHSARCSPTRRVVSKSASRIRSPTRTCASPR